MTFRISGIARPSTIDAAGSIDALRVLARLLVLGIALGVAALFFLPWQQTVTGSGRVIAYAPLERQQTIEAPVEGRVTHWYVQEGDQVEAGDLLVDLSDNDPEIIARLERERDAISAQVEAARLSIAVLETRIGSLETVNSAAVLGASLKSDMARDRRDAAERKMDAAKAARRTAKLNLERQERLEDKGLSSTRSLELAQLEFETAEANFDRARAELKAAKREVKALQADRTQTNADTNAKTDSARSSVQKAKSDKAKAEAELAKIDVRLARQRTMKVVAPRAGSVFRLVAKEGGEMVKQGDDLLMLVPDAESRAVELWVDGNNVPLIARGRHVRLQFEGWPAVQFVGWPSVAVGTFGGTVDFVDATDDGQGQFRVVVVPDESSQPWPDGLYLRQGVRANGWLLLNEVSLGYELWRQFNGFPPTIEKPGKAPRVKKRKN